MSKGLKPGTKVGVNMWPSANDRYGLRYKPFIGVLTEYCNCTGWDVVDIKRDDTGEIESVYTFSVYKLKEQR